MAAGNLPPDCCESKPQCALFYLDFCSAFQHSMQFCADPLLPSRAVCVADGMICTSLNTLNVKLPYCANYSLIQGRQTGILPEKKKAGSEKTG